MKKTKAIVARVREAVAPPMRRAWVGAAVLAAGVAVSGGPAFALGLFGIKTPERKTTGAEVKALAETDPAGASYNAALNAWSEWVAVFVLILVLAGGALVARKVLSRGEGHHSGGLGGIVMAIGFVLLAGGIAA